MRVQYCRVGTCGKVEKNWEMLYNRLAEFHIMAGMSDPDACLQPGSLLKLSGIQPD